MPKHNQTLEALGELVKLLERSEDVGATFSVKIHSTLLQNSIDAINAYKYIADEFAKSIEVQPGENKPKIAVDIERFLAAQWTYKQEENDL